MQSNSTAPSYQRHRYTADIIRFTFWLSSRFSTSFCDVEELMAARGVAVSYETVRRWRLTFGQQYANEIRHRRPRPGNQEHLDDVFLTINGKTAYRWRAVDQYGAVLDILIHRRRNKHAAKRCFRKLLKGCQYVPRVIMTDTRASSGAAKREILPGIEHRQRKRLNNRAEHSHQPTRQRERTMRRFTSAGHAQRFLLAFGPLRDHLCPCRHRLKADMYRQERAQRLLIWNEISGVQLAA